MALGGNLVVVEVEGPRGALGELMIFVARSVGAGAAADR